MIIDGLQCGHFIAVTCSRSLEGSRYVGGVTVTCGFWEGNVESLDSLGRWRDLVRRMPISPDRPHGADIEPYRPAAAPPSSWASRTPDLFGGRIRLVEMFAELGVRVVQLTYNNQNELGGSCYERKIPASPALAGKWCGR
jgi:membrane dipeptidase